MKIEPRFGIFSGSFENDALWLETVAGFAKARARMEQLASQVPGKYFMFSIHSPRSRASVDTSKLARTASGTPVRGAA